MNGTIFSWINLEENRITESMFKADIINILYIIDWNSVPLLIFQSFHSGCVATYYLFSKVIYLQKITCGPVVKTTFAQIQIPVNVNSTECLMVLRKYYVPEMWYCMRFSFSNAVFPYRANLARSFAGSAKFLFLLAFASTAARGTLQVFNYAHFNLNIFSI